MSRKRLLHPLTIVAGLGASALAYAALQQLRTDQPRAGLRPSERDSSQSPVVAEVERASERDGHGDRLEGTDVTNHAAKAGPEPGEGVIDLKWDAMSNDARIRHLRAEFESAVEALEEGKDPAGHRRVAESALSALRAELYVSESGRNLHLAYEDRLEHALGEDAPGVPADRGEP